ncbi:helix-turn-helix domain-containing protein [Streptomyces halstedii]|uniref:helix-turn-helix domain-containing protein n=1 Tax=Streptomyces halstedii TaxID=1944 RepID=UPI0038155007
MSSRPAQDRAPVIPLRPVVPRQPLWRDVVGDVLRGERLAQGRTLKDVAEAARISVPYLSEIERGRKEASSEVLGAASQALGLGLTDVLTLARDALTQGVWTQRPRASGSSQAPERTARVISAGRPRSSGPRGTAPLGEVRLAA